MGTKFAGEKIAHAFCDRCSFRYPLKKLRTYVIIGKRINMRVCPECMDKVGGDHPQNWVGIIGAQKVANDPQALRNPRPDTNLNDSRGLFAFNPVATQTITTTLNDVFITIT
jgi:hypothetical protein